MAKRSSVCVVKQSPKAGGQSGEGGAFDTRVAVYREATTNLPASIEVDSAEAEAIAGRYIAAVKELLGQLDKDKAEIIAPIRKGLDALYAKERALRKPLEERLDAYKGAVARWLTAQHEAQLRAAEKQAAKLEAKGLTGQAQDLRAAAESDLPRTSAEGMTTRMVWVAEIFDEALVPITFSGACLRPVDAGVLKKLASAIGPTSPGAVPGVVFKQVPQIVAKC